MSTRDLPPTIPPSPDRLVEIPDFQKTDLVRAHEIPGFTGFHVVETTEKKDIRKGKPNDPNEDSSCVCPSLKFLSVQDGLGGYPNGEFASACVHHVLPRILERHLTQAEIDVAYAKSLVPVILGNIRNDLITRRPIKDYATLVKYSREVDATLTFLQRDPALALKTDAVIKSIEDTQRIVRETHGATTYAGVLFHTLPDGRRVVMGSSVGDSCSFILRANGTLERLTPEDSQIQSLLDSGRISVEYLYEMEQLLDKENLGEPLSPTQNSAVLKYLNQSAITRLSLGSDVSPIPSIVAKEVHTGDIVIVSTDRLTKGYHRQFGNRTLEEFKKQNGDPVDYELLAQDAQHGATLEERLDYLREETRIWGLDDAEMFMIEVLPVETKTKVAHDWIPGSLQSLDLEPAMNIQGFPGLNVAASIEKKDSRKGNPSDKNQDNVVIARDPKFFGVADGVSSREGVVSKDANEASFAIEKGFEDTFEEGLTRVNIECDTPNALRANGDALVEMLRARRDIADTTARAAYNKSLERFKEICFVDEPELGKKVLALYDTYEMLHGDVAATNNKSTFSGALIHTNENGRRYALAASVGDSPMLLQRKDGSIEQLTYDDSKTHDSMDRGVLTRDQLYEMMRSKEAGLGGELGRIFSKMQSVINRALGGNDAIPELSVVEVFSGDRVIACTDGIGKAFERKVGTMTKDEFLKLKDPLFDVKEFGRVAASTKTPVNLANQLREYAADKGVKDDRAIVVVEIE